MNIMIFADQESKLLYEYYDPEQMKDIDLIISCGDLEPEYLTFFATLCLSLIHISEPTRPY